MKYGNIQDWKAAKDLDDAEARRRDNFRRAMLLTPAERERSREWARSHAEKLHRDIEEANKPWWKFW